jgi:hypothetical protein
VSQRFTIRSFAWLGAATLLLLFVGVSRAEDATPAATSPAAAPASAPSAGQEPFKPAVDAAWAVLQALRDYVHASQTPDAPQQRGESLAKASRALTSQVGLRPGGDEETLPAYVSLWPAVIARYVDGFERDKLIAMPVDAQEIRVIAVAANPNDRRVYDQLFQETTKTLQGQGATGQDLDSRRKILLTRDLARQGIAMPVTATVILTMRKVKDQQGKLQWKATELDMQPPRVPAPGSQVFRRPTIVAPPRAGATIKPATQPAQ